VKLEDCVGCGYCCLAARCLLSLLTFGYADRRCRALEWNGTRYVCLLAKDYGDLLYIGAGCGSSLNSWRKDVRRREDE